MANYRRAVALEPTGFGNVEVADSDVLLVGNINPSSGDLILGGGTAANGVVIAAGHDLDMSGDGVFTLAGTGNLNITASGSHAISGGDLDVNVASDFSNTLTMSGGADIVGTTGSTITVFDAISTVVGGTIGGIVQESLVDKTALELITGQWTFQSNNTTNPKMIVKAAGGEAANSLLFQVQTSAGANLFSVDVEGDVVIAGGETVAGTTAYTGDITLGDGGNTVQLGSAATPAVGDNVYINTTGTADGNFSITTTNFNVATNGNVDTAGDLTFTAGGTIGSTANGDIDITPNGTGEVNITNLAACGSNCNVWKVNQDAVVGTAEYAGTVWLDGDGAANIEGWRWRNDGSTPDFQLQYKQNPTDPSDLTEVWTDIITATPTTVTINAPTLNATTGNFTTITGNFTGTIAACGTSCNAWEINNDAAGGTAEDVGVMFPGGDGANVQNFQFFNDTSQPAMVLRYKQNPTDPADMAEAGYTSILTATSTQVTIPVNVDATSGLDVTGAALTVDANGIDCAGNIDLNNTLSFDAAGTIDTSGNNNLTINTGTQDVLVTADTVDLQTNVTTLDVPDQTGFSIGGTALTTVLWTATAVDIVFGGPASNADAYHTHASVASADQIIVGGLTTAAMSQYQSGYVSANNTITPTDCSSATGTYLTATFAGVYDGTANEIVNAGKIVVQFDAGLAPAPVAGDPAILSWNNAGQFRNRPPAVGSGDFFTWAGIVLDASTYAGTQRCTILIQPSRPVKR